MSGEVEEFISDIDPTDILLPTMSAGSKGAGRAVEGAAQEIGLTPEIPEMPDLSGLTPPTVNTARRRQDEFDRLRRRRGVLSNIFGGQSPGVMGGTRQLLG